MIISKKNGPFCFEMIFHKIREQVNFTEIIKQISSCNISMFKQIPSFKISKFCFKFSDFQNKPVFLRNEICILDFRNFKMPENFGFENSKVLFSSVLFYYIDLHTRMLKSIFTNTTSTILTDLI